MRLPGLKQPDTKDRPDTWKFYDTGMFSTAVQCALYACRNLRQASIDVLDRFLKTRKIAAYSGDVCICSYKSWALYCLILKAKQQAMSAMQPRHFKIESLL